MKRFLPVAIAALALMLVAADVDAAKRFGGGGNLGRQRAVPASPNTTRNAAPSATPAKPAQAQPAPGAPLPKPTFLGRWGGFLAGIGIGVLLTSLFGAQMGPIVGLVLAMLLGFIVLTFLMRIFARRAQPEAVTRPAVPPPMTITSNASGIDPPVKD